MDPVIKNGDVLPAFSLNTLQGARLNLNDESGKILVLNFWSAECPWSEQVDQDLLADLKHWGSRVVYWAIASNANEKSDRVNRAAVERGIDTVLLDPQQVVADLFGAQTTPHLFIIDKKNILRYQGAYNDVTFRNRTPSVFYARSAVNALLSGKHPEPGYTHPYGCAIVRNFEDT